MKIRVAKSFLQRLRGLIGTQSLAPDEGLLIEHCNCIHTFFMRYAIDATFLDKDGKTIKVVRNIKPWRPFVWGGCRARKVLETAATAVSTSSGKS